MEGEDDMPGHVKSSLMGPSLNIPVSECIDDWCLIDLKKLIILVWCITVGTKQIQIRNGRLALGTWQGIYLNEHRDQGGWGGGHTRNIIITLQGQS